jgi:hypothetical protein
MELQENPSNGSWDKPRRYFVPPVQSPLLLTDRIESHYVCRACAGIITCWVPWNSLEWKLRYSGKVPFIVANRNKTYIVVGHAQRVLNKGFEWNPSNKSRDTVEKVLCFSSTYSALHYWSIAIKLTSFVGHTSWMLGIYFQEIPSKENLYKEERSFVFHEKVRFIIDRLQPNLYPL